MRHAEISEYEFLNRKRTYQIEDDVQWLRYDSATKVTEFRRGCNSLLDQELHQALSEFREYAVTLDVERSINGQLITPKIVPVNPRAYRDAQMRRLAEGMAEIGRATRKAGEAATFAVTAFSDFIQKVMNVTVPYQAILASAAEGTGDDESEQDEHDDR